jgi:hypothetical protein
MRKEQMIAELVGKTVVVGGEWLLENDPEMLDWITSSKYWGRGHENIKPEDAVLEMYFESEGVTYKATFEGHPEGVEQSLNNQPMWGEDSWDDWETEDIKKYYILVKNNENLKGVLKMLKSKPKDQLELLLKELKDSRVKKVTIRQYLGSNLFRKSNYQLDLGSKFVLDWSKDKKGGVIKLKIEDKNFFYNENISPFHLQGVWTFDEGYHEGYDEGYDIQGICGEITTNISITI